MYPGHSRQPSIVLTRNVSQGIWPTDASSTKFWRAGDKRSHERNRHINWLRGWGLNPRPAAYEATELPGCSTTL